jgi:hypothetical protein
MLVKQTVFSFARTKQLSKEPECMCTFLGAQLENGCAFKGMNQAEKSGFIL